MVCAHMRLGDARTMGLWSPFMTVEHGSQYCLWVDRLCCTGCASTGTLRTSQALNHQFGHGWGGVFGAFGISTLALDMFDFALTFLAAQVGCERMVSRQYGPGLLDW